MVERERCLVVALLGLVHAQVSQAQVGSVIAHRGVSQAYDRTGLTHDTCTAARMIPSAHTYLENTLPSMRKAFELGADVVEIDIQRTIDGRFAVFHDWSLGCRTNGRGRTRDHSMASLKALDVGHGYTADQGVTFPFRGTAIGAMPALEDVMNALPGRRWLLDVKSNEAADGEALADWLNALPKTQRKLMAVYGGNAPVAEVRARVPEVQTASRSLLKRCLIIDLVVGWTGWANPTCKRLLVLLPISHAHWLWGWPHGAASRFARVNSEIILVGPLEDGPMRWIESPQDLADIPNDFRGGVFVDRMFELSTVLSERRAAGVR